MGNSSSENTAPPRILDPHISRVEREESAAFDCFNDDLAWILDKLVDRTGGELGIVSGHIHGESHPTLLSQSSVAATARSARLTRELMQRAEAVPASGSDHDTLSITYTEIIAELQTHRVMQLTFLPAANVKIVATVSKSGLFGFSILNEINANRLYPVLSRYLRLWWMHRAERREARTLRAALDMSDVGILLLNKDALLLFANSRAARMLDEGDGIRREGRGLVASSNQDSLRLQTALLHTLRINRDSRSNSTGLPAPVLQLGRPGGRRDLIVTLVGVFQPAVDAADPAAILYALDPDQDVEQLLAPVCGIYKLTATEGKLVRHLVNGLRIAEAAARMRIQPQTARAYLKQVFTKTMTHRQADLVRIMLTSAMRTNAPVDLALM